MAILETTETVAFSTGTYDSHNAGRSIDAKTSRLIDALGKLDIKTAKDRPYGNLYTVPVSGTYHVSSSTIVLNNGSVQQQFNTFVARYNAGDQIKAPGKTTIFRI